MFVFFVCLINTLFFLLTTIYCNIFCQMRTNIWSHLSYILTSYSIVHIHPNGLERKHIAAHTRAVCATVCDAMINPRCW